MLSQIYFINPKDQEPYYSRLLLLWVSGAAGYKYSKTYEGKEYDTF